MPPPRFRLKSGKLGPREKGWILLWAAIVCSGGYLRWVYRPAAQRISKVSERIRRLEREKESVQAKMPNLQKRRQGITALKDQISARFDALKEAEGQLLDVQNADELLNSLVKDQGKFELALNSIRQIHEKESSAAEPVPVPAGREEGAGKEEKGEKGEKREKEGPAAASPYKKLWVELDIYATFQGLLNYVDFLETMRPYQQVERIKVQVEGKEISRPHAVLVVSSLMGENLETKRITKEQVFANLESKLPQERKDPFLTQDRPKEVVQAIGLALTGIFSEEGKPVAAMINNEIYRVGDLVDNKRIVSIAPNGVVLEQGNQRFVLAPSQQQSQQQEGQ
ncbi:MAG: hypothetical protein HYZ93_05870 [Candidatus Omnitrophica bacterium]|nr:hypothetical protein [Candidatus Omnitrophota bacterium]